MPAGIRLPGKSLLRDIAADFNKKVTSTIRRTRKKFIIRGTKFYYAYRAFLYFLFASCLMYSFPHTGNAAEILSHSGLLPSCSEMPLPCMCDTPHLPFITVYYVHCVNKLSPSPSV